MHIRDHASVVIFLRISDFRCVFLDKEGTPIRWPTIKSTSVSKAALPAQFKKNNSSLGTCSLLSSKNAHLCHCIGSGGCGTLSSNDGCSRWARPDAGSFCSCSNLLNIGFFQERPVPEPVFMGNMRGSDVYTPRYRRNIEGLFATQEDPYDFWKRTTNPYFSDDEYNMPPPSKRSVDLDLKSSGELESMEDAHMPEKRMYIFRDGFRPSKRSMAIGRAGMRPGKRAFASINRGKRAQMLPESYLPLNRFLFFEDWFFKYFCAPEFFKKISHFDLVNDFVHK